MKKLLFLLSLVLSPILFASHEQMVETMEQRNRIRPVNVYQDNYVYIILDPNSFKSDIMIKARQDYEKECINSILYSDNKVSDFASIQSDNKVSDFASIQQEKIITKYKILCDTISTDVKVLHQAYSENFKQLNTNSIEYSRYNEAFLANIDVNQDLYMDSIQTKVSLVDKFIKDNNIPDRQIHLTHYINDIVHHEDPTFLGFACRVSYKNILLNFQSECIKSVLEQVIFDLKNARQRNLVPASDMNDMFKNLNIN